MRGEMVREGVVRRSARVRVVQGKMIMQARGGWYRHDMVYEDGVKIGHVQVRRQDTRSPLDMITASVNGLRIIGDDIEWLRRQARLNVATEESGHGICG